MAPTDEQLQVLTARLIDAVFQTTGRPTGGGVLEASMGLLRGVSYGNLDSKRTALKDRQVIANICPDVSKFNKQYELLKACEAPHLDAYVNLLARIVAIPSLVDLVSGSPTPPAPALGVQEKGPPMEASIQPQKVAAKAPAATTGALPRKEGVSQARPEPAAKGGLVKKGGKIVHQETEKSKESVKEPYSSQSEFQRPELTEGQSYPPTLSWKKDRPFLTGLHLLKKDEEVQKSPVGKPDSQPGGKVLGTYSLAMQELLVTNDLLHALAGIEGKYFRAKQGQLRGKLTMLFSIDETMDLSLQELARRLLPLCEHYFTVAHFAEARSHFKYGLVSHALQAAIRALLQDYLIMIAQLEHQFRLGRLSLQGLWFYCQPMMGAMQVLFTLVQRATSGALYGAALLNLLQSQAQAMAGDTAARGLLQRLMQESSAPYFCILERWVYEGIIDDPYGEFLIQESKDIRKESLMDDYEGAFWQKHYQLRAEVPAFLASTAQTILTTGKYLNAIRECSQAVQRPAAEERSLHSVPERIYLERINKAHAFASQELLNLLFQKEDLMGRLRSVKHYFLLDQGDFLVHFMDTAKEELAKKPSQISLEKLQSLLELALRTSVASSDPYHEDLTCGIERVGLATQIASIIRVADDDPQMRPVLDPVALAEAREASTTGRTSAQLTGLETFTLDLRVRWPLSLVISRKALTKYAFIFRHLFHCKHVERQLSSTWQVHQATRGLDLLRTSFGKSFYLCQRMLDFILSFEHYMTFEVLEAQWAVMEDKLKAAKSVDEVIELHDEFLDRCLRECMIFWPKILRRVERLKATSLDYVNSTHWLIQSVLPEEANNACWGREASTPVARTSPRAGPPESYTASRERRAQARELAMAHAKRAAEDQNCKDRLKTLEDQFNNELKDLIALLTSCSQTDPYLAHLAQRLQAVGQGLPGFSTNFNVS